MGQVHLFVKDVGDCGKGGIVVMLEGVLRPPQKLFLVIVTHDHIDGLLCVIGFDLLH